MRPGLLLEAHANASSTLIAPVAGRVGRWESFVFGPLRLPLEPDEPRPLTPRQADRAAIWDEMERHDQLRDRRLRRRRQLYRQRKGAK